MANEFRGIFRREAVDHHLSMAPTSGDLLRLSPSWMRWTYPLVLAVVLTGLLYLTLGHIHVYATGPAVIRVSRRADVASPVAAIVEEVAVAPGQRVKAGDLLIRLESAEQTAELDRVTRDFEDQLANHLRDPLDAVSGRNVSSLRAEKEFAERIVETRRLRSPQDGVVEDIRVRLGQPLAPGQIAVTLSSGAPVLQLVAALPGQYRPQLQLGLPAWLELQGYSNAHHHVVLRSIGSEAIGPAEARRFLGAEVADAIPLTGPVIMVQGRLAGEFFRADGTTYSYHDGMQGRLEVRVRSERILFALVPGLRYFTEARRD
jgi:multidrug efflux pump subunit AcrA (membrane-fusion protein)